MTEPEVPRTARRRARTRRARRFLPALLALAVLGTATGGPAVAGEGGCTDGADGLTSRRSRTSEPDGPLLLSLANGGAAPRSGLAVRSGPGEPVWQGDLPPGREVTVTRAVPPGDGPPEPGLSVSSSQCPAPSPVPDAGGHLPDGVPQARLQSWGRPPTARVAPGETFRYTITVVNHGPSAARDVVVTDNLPRPLLFVSSEDGCAARGQKVTCGPRPLVVPGTTASWVILVRLDPAYSGTGEEIANQGSVAAGTPDPRPANNTGPRPGAGLPGGSVTGPTADLAITKKHAATGPAGPGETFDYLLTVVNHGPSEAARVVVADRLPPALAFVSSADGCTGPADAYGAELSCPVADRLAPDTPKTYALTVRLDPDYRGDGADVVNRATVSSATADPVPANDTAALTGLPNLDGSVRPGPPTADHAVTVASATAVQPGRRSTARLTVSNLGPSTRRQPAAVTVTMPERTRVPDSGLPPGCEAEQGGRRMRCTVAPGLRRAADGPFAVDFPVDVAPSAPPNAPLAGGSAVVSSPEDRNSTNDSASWNAATLGGSADLETTKRAVLGSGRQAVSPGDVFTYRVGVRNHGPSDARGVTVTDPLPAPLVLVSAPDGCGAVGRTVTCRPPGPLPAGETVRFELTVRLAEQFRGTGVAVDNIATATSDTPDPDPANNSNRPATTGPDGGPLPVTLPPSPSPSPSPSPEPTVRPTPPPPPTPTPGPQPLPDTGSHLPTGLPVAASVALLAGAGLVTVARRRRPRT
ncbi:DUF11 domain-containing protein [Kitasatospora albolonga]|uniref:DUF11 domain-containing protein n=1 Tax=Kitasatospora albolonga TaxID=68173 RepID=UPI0035E84441